MNGTTAACAQWQHIYCRVRVRVKVRVRVVVRALGKCQHMNTVQLIHQSVKY